MQRQVYWMERLDDLGALLAQRGQHYSVLLVGGVALGAHGIRLDQPTVDVDVLAREVDEEIVPGLPLPAPLADAAAVVAEAHGLARDWFNAQAAGSFASGMPLPEGIEERASRRTCGGLTMLMAARGDLVALKLHAAIDQFAPRRVNGKHRTDLALLDPTSPELDAALAWLERALPDHRSVHELAHEIIQEDGLG